MCSQVRFLLTASLLLFVSRIHSSKFWVMEAGKKTDLLIICRWANPIQDEDVMCGICKRKWFKPVRVSCGDTFCAGCVLDQFANESKTCPICNDVMKEEFQADKIAQQFLYRYEEERQAPSG